MSNRSKKYIAAAKKINREKVYSIEEAIKLSLGSAFAKFDETVDIAFKLGVDPRHSDQMIRGSVSLPAGTGKTTKVCVITSGEKIKDAETAGADFVGGDDIITKIQGGWMEFDRVIASPEMMGKIGRIARVLGPRGLMPNPKLGTVTTDIGAAVREQKAGKVEYRVEKAGIVHIPIGKKSFGVERILENFKAISSVIVRSKPASSKGNYLRSITLSTTMGPGVKVDPLEVMVLADKA
jgi:large subunit ribosomal protein L1